METRKIEMNGMAINIPAYYQQVESMPEDPKGSVPFAVQTNNAMCFVLAMPISPDQAIPFGRNDAIRGIRHFLQDNQGIIAVESGEGYVYSIVKTLKQPSGVQYNLTFQQCFDQRHILMVQGFFEEIGTTGIRDNMVFELCQREGLVGSGSNPLEGWAKDPYDEKCKKGALMNISEEERFDAQFPGFPLTMCRELVKTMIEN